MLVAITLLAVIAVIAWRGLDAMTRGRERLTDHDNRLNTLKLLYGQFQSDCEHLTSPSLLQASPVELGNGQVLMVRDRRDEGRPAQWQVVVYRLDGNTVVRAASPPVDNRNAVQAAMVALHQTDGGANLARALVGDADSLSARAWIEPGGWQTENGRIAAALLAGSANAGASASASAAAASGVSAGASVATTVVRAIELNLTARMGDGDTPRHFQKICMTGL
jgi:general secretion pathway protein J